MMSFLKKAKRKLARVRVSAKRTSKARSEKRERRELLKANKAHRRAESLIRKADIEERRYKEEESARKATERLNAARKKRNAARDEKARKMAKTAMKGVNAFAKWARGTKKK
jgi:serine phosphatase RsbU (regulator of sigma subunit)